MSLEDELCDVNEVLVELSDRVKALTDVLLRLEEFSKPSEPPQEGKG